MSFSVSTALSEATGMLHGTTLNQIPNPTLCVNRAARQVMLDIDPQETKMIQAFSTPVFPIVFDYPLPSDVKGNKIIDVYPQIGRHPDNVVTSTYNQVFDRYKSLLLPSTFSIISNQGTKRLRISYLNKTSGNIINTVGTILGNGTWAIGGVATTLVQNMMTLINGSNSLQFNLGIGSNTLTNSTMTAVDLTTSLNQTGIIFKLYLPSIAGLTNISFRFGSDASNYYQSPTLTSQISTLPFVADWNDIGALWANCTQVGIPVLTNIKYVQITFTASAPITAIQVAQIWSSLGVMMDLEYYSKYLFQDATTGAWKETTTATTDTINLDTESYNIFLYQLALQLVQQALGSNAEYDTNLMTNAYQGAVVRYKKMYKSEISHPSQAYYRPTFKGYNNSVISTTSPHL